jgi:membrane protein DedA with SNARE-associated domain
VPVASITEHITSLIGDHGVYAVFLLMVVDAVFPTASELVMVYGGALAAGAFAGQDVVLFGHEITTPFWAFLTVALAGTIGYTIGSVLGWGIGVFAGRPFLERHGRWLHLSPEKLDRAERWFEKHGDAAVFLGRVTPLIRSFVAIPAGVARMPLGPYTLLTLLGSSIWCFGFAGAGWAFGKSYSRFHHDFRYVEIAVAVLLVAGVVWLILRRRSSRLARRAADPTL